MIHVDPLARFDRDLADARAARLLGADEVGRGCLAGPLVAAAVELPLDDSLVGVNDSKRLSPSTRVRLAGEIRSGAIACGWSFVSAARIDAINIRQATLVALRRCIRRATALAVDVAPGPGGTPATTRLVLVDGLDTVPGIDAPQLALVGGDGLSRSIAAASIVAKAIRDAFMMRLALDYPEYGFEHNKGYGTPDHLAALRRHGPCPWHRRSFAPIVRQPSFADVEPVG